MIMNFCYLFIAKNTIKPQDGKINLDTRLRINYQKFKGKEYTSAIIVGKQFNHMTAEYFEVFDDSIVLGVGTINDCVAG